MKSRFIYFILLIISISIVQQACTKKEIDTPVNTSGNHSPNLPDTDYAYDNASNSNNKVAKLGRVLFYDTYLSFNNLISCGSCHIQSKGFANNLQFNQGVKANKLKRNTPSISGDGALLFWDGRSNSLTDLVLRPVQNHDEMLQDINELPTKLKGFAYYAPLFKEAYGSEEITIQKIQNALARFCSTFTKQNTKINTLNGIVNTSLFTALEKEGFSVFMNKGQCVNCHHISNSEYASNNTFQNIGLDLTYSDQGLYNITKNESDKGKFRVPSLANISLTAPYMHDGRFNTLVEVIDFYSEGIQPHPNLSSVFQDGERKDTIIKFEGQQFTFQTFVPNGSVRTIGLSENEKKALLEFLNLFTDNDFISNPKFSNPF